MNDEQGIFRRLDHYADCIEKGVHVTGTQLKSLVKDIRERGLVSYHSPPAEAQRCTCPSGDGSLRWPCPAHPPPSAPVGVAADILRIVDTAIDVCNDRDRPAMAEDLEAVRLYVEQASAALAGQQPAAVDDDTLESLIEESDGHWSEDEFRIEGPDLMRLLRDAALAGQQGENNDDR